MQYVTPGVPYLNKAVSPRPVETGTLFPGIAALRKMYLPVAMAPVWYGSVQILPRTDPVLMYLSPVRTESTYHAMSRSESAIGTSIRSLRATLFSFGYEIAVSKERRKAKAAIYLKDMTKAAIRCCPGLRTALKESIYAVYEGWVPIQRWWKPDGFRFKGTPYWGCDRVIVHPQDRFAFTPNRELVWLGYGASEPEILGANGEQPGWYALSCGSTLDPYGDAILKCVYMLWRLKQFFLEKFARGISNAISGIPIFKERGLLGYMPSAPGAETTSAALGTLLQEAQEACRILEEKGFLVVRGNLDFEKLETINYSEGWVKAINYLDRCMQLAIEFQHLTSALGDEGGARSLGEVQERTKMDGVRDIAGEGSPVGQSLIDDLVRFNVREVEGVDVDPEDIPQFRYRVTGLLDMAKAQAFIDMGGVLLMREVAADQNLPMAEQEDIDAGEPVLQLKSLTAPLAQDAQETRQDGPPGPEDRPVDGGPSRQRESKPGAQPRPNAGRPDSGRGAASAA